MDFHGCVLIVDASEENREVLQTALERRGLRTLAAGRVRQGQELARRHQPDLIVLDLDTNGSTSPRASVGFFEQTGSRPTPLVLLGTAGRTGAAVPEGEFVAKPYHYGPLIRKIEELLGATG